MDSSDSSDGIEKLPSEILVLIASFLEPEELSALSGTCVKFRNFFNDNSFWKRFLTPRILSKIKGIRENLPKLKLALSVKRSRRSKRLSPLCKNRVLWMKYKKYKRVRWEAHCAYWKIMRPYLIQENLQMEAQIEARNSRKAKP